MKRFRILVECCLFREGSMDLLRYMWSRTPVGSLIKCLRLLCRVSPGLRTITTSAMIFILEDSEIDVQKGEEV